MSPKEIFQSVESLNCEFTYTTYILHLLPLFNPICIYIHVWIRIQKTPEYGTNTYLDPQHWSQPIYLICSSNSSNRINSSNTVIVVTCSPKERNSVIFHIVYILHKVYMKMNDCPAQDQPHVHLGTHPSPVISKLTKREKRYFKFKKKYHLLG